MYSTARRRFLFASAACLGAQVLQGVGVAAPPALPVLYDGSEITDWYEVFARITFRNLPPAIDAGTVEVDPATVAQLGYNPNRSWAAGTPVDRILMLGDIQLPEVFGPQRFSLEQIAGLALRQIDLSALNLAEFGLAPLQSVGSLLTAIPSLASRTLSQVPPLRDLFALTRGIAAGSPFATIGQIVRLYPQFAQELLGRLPDLTRYGLASIPGLVSAPLMSLRNWAQGYIAQIPGLADVPWAKFGISQLLSGRFAVIDLVLGAKEALVRSTLTNTVTGSSLEGFNVPCGPASCSHVELVGAGFRGLRHIINPAQSLQGGFGILRWINGGREGAGWEPFGPNGPKVGILGLSERTDSVQFGLFFFIDAWWFGSHLGRSPKFLGVPFFSARVRSLIPGP